MVLDIELRKAIKAMARAHKLAGRLNVAPSRMPSEIIQDIETVQSALDEAYEALQAAKAEASQNYLKVV